MSYEPFSDGGLLIQSGIPVRIMTSGGQGTWVRVPQPAAEDEGDVLTVQPDLSVAWEPPNNSSYTGAYGLSGDYWLLKQGPNFTVDTAPLNRDHLLDPDNNYVNLGAPLVKGTDWDLITYTVLFSGTGNVGSNPTEIKNILLPKTTDGVTFVTPPSGTDFAAYMLNREEIRGFLHSSDEYWSNWLMEITDNGTEGTPPSGSVTVVYTTNGDSAATSPLNIWYEGDNNPEGWNPAGGAFGLGSIEWEAPSAINTTATAIADVGMSILWSHSIGTRSWRISANLIIKNS